MRSFSSALVVPLLQALAFLGADELPLNGSCREAPQAPIGGPCSGLKGAHLGDSLLVEGYDDSSVDCQLSAAEKVSHL